MSNNGQASVSFVLSLENRDQALLDIQWRAFTSEADDATSFKTKDCSSLMTLAGGLRRVVIVTGSRRLAEDLKSTMSAAKAALEDRYLGHVCIRSCVSFQALCSAA